MELLRCCIVKLENLSSSPEQQLIVVIDVESYHAASKVIKFELHLLFNYPFTSAVYFVDHDFCYFLLVFDKLFPNHDSDLLFVLAAPEEQDFDIISGYFDRPRVMFSYFSALVDADPQSRRETIHAEADELTANCTFK